MADSRERRLSRREAINLLGVGAGLGFVTAFQEGSGLLAASTQATATKVTFPKGAIIRTILKDVSPDALGSGATLFHDHLSLTTPRPYAPPPTTPVKPQWLEDVASVVEEVKAARKDGVTCIVSGGTRDLGQKPADVRRIAEQVASTGMHIVLSDALWTQPAYPPDIPKKTEDQIADEFTRDAIAQRWGALGELGSSMQMHPDERKVFRAIAKVHLRTGIPIFTHMPHEGCKTCGAEQLDIFERVGVDPQHRADEDHARPGRADQVAQHGAAAEQEDVGPRAGAQLAAQQQSAGDNIERRKQHDEGDVLLHAVPEVGAGFGAVQEQACGHGQRAGE